MAIVRTRTHRIYAFASRTSRRRRTQADHARHSMIVRSRSQASPARAYENLNGEKVVERASRWIRETCSERMVPKELVIAYTHFEFVAAVQCEVLDLVTHRLQHKQMAGEGFTHCENGDNSKRKDVDTGIIVQFFLGKGFTLLQ